MSPMTLPDLTLNRLAAGSRVGAERPRNPGLSTLNDLDIPIESIKAFLYRRRLGDSARRQVPNRHCLAEVADDWENGAG